MIGSDFITCIDCIEGLRSIPAGSVDLILTSPPYNFGMEYDTHEDKIDYVQYFAWLEEVFLECARVLADGGRIVVNVQPNFSDYVPTHHRVSEILRSHGLLFKGEIIWNKNNWNCKVCSFGSWKSASMPYLKYKWEFIEIFCKGNLKHERREGHEDDICSDEFMQWTVAMWNVPPEHRMEEFGHPAMMPEELAKRCIKLFSFTNDVVLDPFCGTGTTCLVAHRYNRRYIGFDISKQYCETAVKRIEEQKRNGVQAEFLM